MREPSGRKAYLSGRIFTAAAAVLLLLWGCEDPVSSAGGGAKGSLWLTPVGQSVVVGNTIYLYASGLASSGGPAALGEATWSSSNESVAAVQSSSIIDVFGAQSRAVILGVSEGAADIHVRTELGERSTRVTVVAPAP